MAKHPRQKQTHTLLESINYFQQIEDGVEFYVKTWLVYEQDKVETQAPQGFFEPLLITKQS